MVCQIKEEVAQVMASLNLVNSTVLSLRRSRVRFANGTPGGRSMYATAYSLPDAYTVVYTYKGIHTHSIYAHTASDIGTRLDIWYTQMCGNRF